MPRKMKGEKNPKPPKDETCVSTKLQGISTIPWSWQLQKNIFHAADKSQLSLLQKAPKQTITLFGISTEQPSDPRLFWDMGAS